MTVKRPLTALAKLRVEYRRYPTLINLDLARGGGTAKVVRDGLTNAQRRQFLRMILVVGPFLASGAALLIIAHPHENVAMQLAGPFLIVTGYLLEIYIVQTQRYLDMARVIPWDLTKAISVIEADPSQWKDLTRRGGINEQLERVARSYTHLPVQLRGGDPHTLAVFRGWGLEMATSVRDLKQWVAHPSAFTYTDLLHRLSVDLNSALDGRWSEIPRAVPPGDSNLGSPRQRAAWLTLGALLLASAITILVAYSSKLGDGGPLVVSLLGALGLMAMTKGGLPLEGLIRAKGTLDELRK
jgi:hypothetical protein